MKKIHTLIKATVLLATLALLTVTCSKTGSGDYRALVPEDAFFTMSFNVNSMMDKAGYSEAEMAALRGQAEMGMAFMGAALAEDDKKHILSIIDSPDNMGISFKNDVYISVSVADIDEFGNADTPQAAIIAKVSDPKKFKKTIDLLNRLNPGMETRSGQGFDVIVLNETYYSTFLLAYNDNAAVLIQNQEDFPATISFTEQLFKGSRSSILDNKEISKFTNGKSDIGFLMNYGPIMDMVKDQLPAGMPYLDILASARIWGNTDFGKGKITTDMGIVFTDKEAKKQYEDLYAKSKLNGKFSKYLSDNAFLAAAGYLDGSQIYEMLTKIPETSMIGFFPDARKIMESFDGELFLSISGIHRQGVTGSLLATVKDSSMLDFLFEQYGGYTDIVRIDGDYYVIDLDEMSFTCGIKDDILFISNDSEILAALDGNKVNGPDKSIVSMFDKGMGAFYIDIDKLGDIIADTFLYGDYGSSSTMVALEFMGMFRDAYVHAQDTEKVEMVVRMTDSDKNALATIADKIRSFAMASMF